MNKFRQFNPDLIVEATSVCDRNCSGCYAPNVISQGLPFDLYENRPELFLQPEMFQQSILSETLKDVQSIAFRGGEPSKHPFLYELIQIAHSMVNEVYIETHGRWILNPQGYLGLMQKSAELGTILKLSYDRMHGLSSVELHEITKSLDEKNIKWVVAITESSDSQFLETRSKCQWISDEKIIQQRKAGFQTDLIKPRLGVMSVRGSVSNALTVKKDFKRTSGQMEASL